MKSIKLIGILIFLFFSQIIQSQNDTTPKDLNPKTFNLNPSIENILANLNEQVNSFDVCGETYSWDSLSQQFTYTGSTIIEYDDLEETRTLTIHAESLVDGEQNYIRMIIYLSFQDLLFNELFIGDSVHIYLGDADGNFQLLSRTINHYEDEKIILAEEYFNYGPLGMIKSGLTRYYYDQNKFLVAEGRDAFDFSTFSLLFSDSSAYTNNALGLPLEKVDYQLDFFSSNIVPYNKDEYSYVNDDQLSELIQSSYENNSWIKISKELFEYDNNGLRTSYIYFESEDDGQTFDPVSRSLSNYEDVIPLNIPSSELSQEMINGQWVNESLSTFENCIIDATQDQFLEINAWIDQNNLILRDLPSDNNAILNLYTVDGLLVYNLKGNQIKERNDISSLLPGIYILEYRTSDLGGSLKLIKGN